MKERISGFIKKISHVVFKTASRISGKNRAYFDYASITPIDTRVLKCMSEAADVYPANPSSLYEEGVLAKKTLEQSRKSIADVLDVHSDEITFTSGGTESNNLALLSVVQSLGSAVSRTFSGTLGAKIDHETIQVTLKPHVIALAIEHPSVLETLEYLKKHNVDVTLVPVEQDGIVLAKRIKEALRAQTVLVTVMYVNNEIGTIQPLSEIAKALRSYKKSLGRDNFSMPFLHTDACQAACYMPLRVPSLGVDMMTLDASKFYGPRSSGVLYVRRGITVIAQLYGGDQEGGRRPGTEDVSKSMGFSYALTLARDEMESESVRLAALRDDLIGWMLEHIKGARVNGSHEIGSIVTRAPNNINICIPEKDAEYMVLQLDAMGFAVSSVTSCQNLRENSYSQVINSLGNTCDDSTPEGQKNKKIYRDCAQSSLRITLGRFTTKQEVERLKKALTRVL